MTLATRTVSLYAVDLTEVTRRWRNEALPQAPPRGRVRAALGGAANGTAASHPQARDLFDAWIEDCAAAAVFDAPTKVVEEIGEALDLPRLQSAPVAYPAELVATDEHAAVVWLEERPRFELAAGALAGVEPTLRADLLEAVRALFDALAPGMAVVAIRV